MDKLGLDVLQRLPPAKLLALRAGNVRIPVFYDRPIDEIRVARAAGGHIIFRTPQLVEAWRP